MSTPDHATEQALIALDEIESGKRNDAWLLRRIATIRAALDAARRGRCSGIGMADELERAAGERVPGDPFVLADPRLLRRAAATLRQDT